MLPLFCPQVASVVLTTCSSGAPKSAIVYAPTASQPLLSLTVTLYCPAGRLLADVLLLTLGDHVKVNPVLGVTLIVMLPLSFPQVASTTFSLVI